MITFPRIPLLTMSLLLLVTGCAAPAPSATTPAALTWSARAASPTTLYEGQGAVTGGRLYVFGGFFENRDNKPIATQAAHVYDPATDRWAARQDAPDAVTHAGTAADGATLYVAGGFLGNHPGPQTDHVWRYDTVADTWTAMPPLPAARGAGALVRMGRQLHFFGGTERTDGGTYRRDTADHWVLNLDDPTGWTARAPLPTARNHLGGAVLGGHIYAIGGQFLGDEASGNVTQVDRYDPATDTWQAVAPLPLPLGHITASIVVQAGRIVVIGGVTQARDAGAIEGHESSVVLAYDPAANQWQSTTALPGPRQSPVADTIDGALVVTTGSTAAGPVDSTVVGHH